MPYADEIHIAFLRQPSDGVRRSKIGMPDHSEHPFNAPVGKGFDKYVGGCFCGGGGVGGFRGGFFIGGFLRFRVFSRRLVEPEQFLSDAADGTNPGIGQIVKGDFFFGFVVFESANGTNINHNFAVVGNI